MGSLKSILEEVFGISMFYIKTALIYLGLELLNILLMLLGCFIKFLNWLDLQRKKACGRKGHVLGMVEDGRIFMPRPWWKVSLLDREGCDSGFDDVIRCEKCKAIVIGGMSYVSFKKAPFKGYEVRYNQPDLEGSESYLVYL